MAIPLHPHEVLMLRVACGLALTGDRRALCPSSGKAKLLPDSQELEASPTSCQSYKVRPRVGAASERALRHRQQRPQLAMHCHLIISVRLQCLRRAQLLVKRVSRGAGPSKTFSLVPYLLMFLVATRRIATCGHRAGRKACASSQPR